MQWHITGSGEPDCGLARRLLGKIRFAAFA